MSEFTYPGYTIEIDESPHEVDNGIYGGFDATPIDARGQPKRHMRSSSSTYSIGYKHNGRSYMFSNQEVARHRKSAWDDLVKLLNEVTGRSVG